MGFETGPRGWGRAATVAGSEGKPVLRVPPGRVVLEKRGKSVSRATPLRGFLPRLSHKGQSFPRGPGRNRSNETTAGHGEPPFLGDPVVTKR